VVASIVRGLATFKSSNWRQIYNLQPDGVYLTHSAGFMLSTLRRISATISKHRIVLEARVEPTPAREGTKGFH
jgi:hypothetical protein